MKETAGVGVLPPLAHGAMSANVLQHATFPELSKEEIARYGQLASRMQELDSAEEIVVHCKMGGRSAEAYTLLKQAGFTKIKNLQGGILAWADQVDHTMPKY